MDSRDLKRRGGKWYVRYNVPRRLRATLGKSELLRTTGTGDLAVARTRRASILAALQQEAQAVLNGSGESLYGKTLRDIARGAYDQSAETDPESGEAGDGRLEGITMALDPDHGGDRLPQEQREALRDAMVALREGKSLPVPARLGISLGEAAAGFVDAVKGTITGQTLSQHEAVLDRLKEYVGASRPLRAITRKEAAEFFDSQPVAPKTRKRYASSLNQLWKWASRRGEVSGDNPFAGHSFKAQRGKSSGWVPWEVEELNKLLKGDTGKSRALYWVPRIALFSGLRLNEICSLTGGDVRRESGVWVFDISESKSEAGVRKVPLHSSLLALGFLDILPKDKDALVFPELKPGGPDLKHSWYFSRKFTAFRRSLGLERSGVVFHSLRKNVATALERARVPESEAVSVLGHEKLSMSYSVYSIGLTVKQLREIVEKIKYPGLRLR